MIVDYDYRSNKNRVFYKYLESHHQFKNSVIILAVADEDIISKVYSQGGNIINKPYDPNELLGVLKKV